MLGVPVLALEPEQRAVELRPGQGVRERAVDVDPDQEPGVLGEHLRGRGAAQRVPDDARVPHVQAPGQGESGRAWARAAS